MKYLIALLFFSLVGFTQIQAQDVINAGKGGNSTADLLKRYQRDVLDNDPTLVVILVGANDHLNSRKLVSIEQYSKNLETLINRVSENGIEVVLVTPPPCIPSFLYTRHDPKVYKDISPEKRLQGAAEVMLKLGEENGIPVVDFHQYLIEKNLVHEGKDSIIRNPANSGAKDGVHPTAEGYKLLAKLVHETISKHKLNPTRVVCFGDSITYGAGMKGAGTAKGETWPGYLARHMEK